LDKGNRQYSQSSGGIFDRGTIYFTDKDGNMVSAATLQSGFIIAIDPQILKNPETTYSQINAILPLDHTQFMAKANATTSPYQEIATQVSEDQGNAVNALGIAGVSVYQQRWRYYPASTLAANTVGFMAYQGNTYEGRYGLERQYDSTLTRNDDAYTNFFAQIFSNMKQTEADLNEGDIVTSIEPTVQSFLQTELQQIQTQYQSESTGGIIINPATGAIYAMASIPSFDLNNTKNVSNVSLFENPLVENVYEMGSVMKPLTVAAGIDLGAITASSTYDDKGCISIDGQKICNFDSLDRGQTTIQTALSQSLNLGMDYIVSQIGDANFDKYFYAFGVAQKTGIDLPNEGADLVANLQSPREVEHYTAAFGQGIALTPMATVRALSAVANGGVLITPHVVTQINYTNGLTKTLSYPAQSRAIKQSTSQAVATMMVYSTDNVLDQGKDKMPNYSIAVKTGTAQIEENGVYSPNDVLHSFVAFFPAYDPKFLLFFYTVKPQNVEYASESLTQPVFDTIHFLINYYEVPPDR
jgi:cell division protein FtsI/penicillin-binding protein 2